jgi:hypothetical protein
VTAVPALTDPAVTPTPELVAAALGTATPAWTDLTEALTGLGLAIHWHMYADHPAWLAKVQRGAKTVAWLSAWVGHGRATVYLAARHREQLLVLDVRPALRRQVEIQPMIGRTLPVVIDLRTRPDAAEALEVVRFKLNAR